MAQYTIAVIVGSLRKDSYNRKLVNALGKMLPEGFAFNILEIGNLPLYNQDDDSNPAEVVTKFKSDISAAQGLIFATPEYNRSIPGVLKNALDHASRPYGKNAWAKKPAGVIGASIGATGTALAQQHLRNILSYLDVPVMTQPEAYLKVSDEFFDASGNVTEASRKFVQSWVDSYVAWVKKLA